MDNQATFIRIEIDCKNGGRIQVEIPEEVSKLGLEVVKSFLGTLHECVVKLEGEKIGT